MLSDRAFLARDEKDDRMELKTNKGRLTIASFIFI